MSKARQLAQKPSQPTGRKNLIINGAMQVAQRGTSKTGITSSGYYVCDRWRWDSSAADTVTIERSSDAPDDFKNSYKVTVTGTTTTSSQRALVITKLEGQDLQHINQSTSTAKPLILSFYAKHSVTGNYHVYLRSVKSETASDNAVIAKTYTVSDTGWNKYTLSFPANTSVGNGIITDTTVGLEIVFVVDTDDSTSGGSNMDTWVVQGTDWAYDDQVQLLGTSNATFQLTGVQLEVGSTATDFEHRSFGEELSLCHRYFFVPNSITMYCHYVGSSNAYIIENSCPPTAFRASPSITGTFSTGGGAVSTDELLFASTKRYSFRAQITNAGGDTGRVVASNIEIDAEL